MPRITHSTFILSLCTSLIGSDFVRFTTYRTLKICSSTIFYESDLTVMLYLLFINKFIVHILFSCLLSSYFIVLNSSVAELQKMYIQNLQLLLMWKEPTWPWKDAYQSERIPNWNVEWNDKRKLRCFFPFLKLFPPRLGYFPSLTFDANVPSLDWNQLSVNHLIFFYFPSWNIKRKREKTEYNKKRKRVFFFNFIYCSLYVFENNWRL